MGLSLKLGFVVSAFGRNITLRRRSPATKNNGIWTPGATVTDTTIKSTIQPATPQDLKILPEGERRNQVMLVLTLVRLYVSGDLPNQQSDIVIDPENSRQYKVISAADWSHNGFYTNLAEYQPT